MHHDLASHVLESLLAIGVQEFCVCPGARNTPFVYPLAHSQKLKVYYWFEERSAAFFALGRSKVLNQPVAIITTSGTAAAELLPAAMEAHYTNVPLVLVTADRPRRFRGSGAPQAAEQVNLFGCYAHFSQDLEGGDSCSIQEWSLQGPAHLNVCLEEPVDSECQQLRIDETCLQQQNSVRRFFIHSKQREKKSSNILHPVFTYTSSTLDSKPDLDEDVTALETFFQTVRRPLVVVGSLAPSIAEKVVDFLVRLNAPVYAEAISGIREHSRIAHLRIHHLERSWEYARNRGYAIDGILRLGGVPTIRLWRDLEDQQRQVAVCSISDHPFSGLSRGGLLPLPLSSFLEREMPIPSYNSQLFEAWRLDSIASYQQLLELFLEEPQAEPSLIHRLSYLIPTHSRVYLGNSLPIREWDLAATFQDRSYAIGANRGLNGIDGQLSSFFGFSLPNQSNWGIFGDLTTLYDLAAPWILSQLEETQVQCVVINNGGGKIFSRLFAHPAIQNRHQIGFESVARLWKIDYQTYKGLPSLLPAEKSQLIEIVPDETATQRLWQAFHAKMSCRAHP
jgi:2-succinyl-5-enolpyruvyl-6-hydroxy-3-cyclohexene-1-carboxylate synthase